MANSWKFMLKKNQLTCFIFNINFHEYSINFHKLLYKPFLFFYLSYIIRMHQNSLVKWNLICSKSCCAMEST